MSVDFTLDPATRDLRDRVRTFVRDVVGPREGDAVDAARHRLHPQVLTELRTEARKRGLWAPHMPEAYGGMGLGPVALAVVHEELGWSPLGALSLNCMAPDEGNMDTLLEFANEDQKARYLRPLVAGETRSCFAMTEPGGAGADASMVTATATRDGDDWLLNGRKWFATGADGAAFTIVLARSDPDAPTHDATSLFLVDAGTPGYELVRNVPVMGSPFPGGHGELNLTDVRVPPENVLGELGRGFHMAQARLGLGRIGHACRWIGLAQRAQDLAAARALERETFGRPLARRQAVQWMLAESAEDLYVSRLMVLHAAWKIETGRDHRQEISFLKRFVANALNRVVDRAVQIHGGEGVTHDTPLALWYQEARSARIYDGPDEIHRFVVARNVLRAMEREGATRSAAEVAE